MITTTEKMDFSVLHRAEWWWLAEHPDAEREDWPERKILGEGKLVICQSLDFACEAAYTRTRLDPQASDPMRKRTNLSCSWDYCPLWITSKKCYYPGELMGRHTELSPEKLPMKWYARQERASVARMIAEKEWHGEKMYPIRIDTEKQWCGGSFLFGGESMY